jgi:hypothetical protein
LSDSLRSDLSQTISGTFPVMVASLLVVSSC